jgi:transcriptional regulator with XRE-family HTH domain
LIADPKHSGEWKKSLKRLGNHIREIRIQRGFKSQEEFADYCKLHRTFVGHLETRRKDFRLTTIIRVAEVLGLTMQELFAGIEGERPFKNTARRTPGTDAAAILREISKLGHSIVRLKEYASSETRKNKPGSRVAKQGSRKRSGETP